MRRPIRFDDDRSGTCFGCGSANHSGLRLEFYETEDGVEVEYAAPEALAGAPGIVHGGIQATLLDEAMCMTAYAKGGTGVVTGELTVRYLRTVPTRTPLVIRGGITERRNGSFFIAGSIALAGTDEELTRAQGRFFAAPPAAKDAAP
ncbi:MAG: PaaI family thioesterase [Thermodesulfobacteriota bacterium]